MPSIIRSFGAGGLGLILAVLCLRGTPEENSPRVTSTVRIVRKTEPAVAAVFSQAEGQLNMGSGSVVHEDGFILTNDHVVTGFPGVILLRDHKLPIEYRIVGRMPEKDLCLLKVDAGKDLKSIKLGNSHDLMTGEPILCAGNPGGRGVVFSAGIVSSPNFILGAPNALVMRYFSGDVRDRFIQFDAASNKGNSGGPLINALGEQVGVVSNKSYAEENINFAIPIDRVRSNLEELFAPEIRKNFFSGISLDPLIANPTVHSVVKGSPADKSGILDHDLITSLNGKPIRGYVDWLAELMNLEKDASMKLSILRKGKALERELKLAAHPMPPTKNLEEPKPGLLFQVCQGQFEKAPDFERQKIIKKGISRSFNVLAIAAPLKDDFAIRLEGFLKVPASGVFRLILNSDDGSVLRIGEKVIVDNDGPHPAQDVGTLIRLQKGYTPIRIDYFEATGDAELSFFLEDASGERKPAEKFLYH